MKGKDIELHWIHGLVAVILSLSLLVASPHIRISRVAMDFTYRILSVPEYPAVLLRDSLKNLSAWMKDKQEFQKELDSLKLQNMRLRGLIGVEEADRLADSIDNEIAVARVTFRPPASWWSEVRINKGENDGITVGLPVLRDGFVVGRIAGVDNYSSWVELITSSSMMIPVVVDETRELGVIAGDGTGKTWLMYLPDSSDILTGMAISTALVSETLPPGLPIGRVDKTMTKKIAGSSAYRVVLGGDISRLLKVEIYKPGKDH